MSNAPRPYFAIEVHSGGFIPHRWLFEEYVEQMLHQGGFGGSHIYYLTRIKKLRFVPGSACITSDQELRVEVAVGAARRVQVSVKLASISPFSASGLDDFAPLSPSVDQATTTALTVSITLDLGGKIRSLPIPIENLIAATDLDFGDPPEILYVGQSFEMLERWRNHKQVNRALTTLADDEDLRLYFIHFRFFASIKSFGDVQWNALLDVSDRDQQTFRDRISVLEQALIQFYRPALNSQHVGGNPATAQYARIVAATGIKGVGMSLGMYGCAFQFWSPRQRLKSEVVTLVDENGVPTFHDGLMLD